MVSLTGIKFRSAPEEQQRPMETLKLLFFKLKSIYAVLTT
jgi:hypothetical protein